MVVVDPVTEFAVVESIGFLVITGAQHTKIGWISVNLMVLACRFHRKTGCLNDTRFSVAVIEA